MHRTSAPSVAQGRKNCTRTSRAPGNVELLSNVLYYRQDGIPRICKGTIALFYCVHLGPEIAKTFRDGNVEAESLPLFTGATWHLSVLPGLIPLSNADVLDQSALYSAASAGDHESRSYGQDDRRRIITS